MDDTADILSVFQNILKVCLGEEVVLVVLQEVVFDHLIVTARHALTDHLGVYAVFLDGNAVIGVGVFAVILGQKLQQLGDHRVVEGVLIGAAEHIADKNGDQIHRIAVLDALLAELAVLHHKLVIVDIGILQNASDDKGRHGDCIDIQHPESADQQDTRKEDHQRVKDAHDKNRCRVLGSAFELRQREPRDEYDIECNVKKGNVKIGNKSSSGKYKSNNRLLFCQQIYLLPIDRPRNSLISDICRFTVSP